MEEDVTLITIRVWLEVLALLKQGRTADAIYLLEHGLNGLERITKTDST